MIYLNGEPLPVTIFPDNTSQCWKIPEDALTSPFVNIKWVFSNEAEILHLAQLKDLLDIHQVDACLTMTYLPYGRQDKEVSNKSTFALRTFAKILNAMKFKMVSIHDPHSKVALDIIENSHAVYPTLEVQKVIRETKSNMICYPDHGALSKYIKEYYELGMIPYIHGEKVRDQLTGNITSYKVIGDPAAKNVLILDDLCDGGMTFKILAKDLLALGAKSVALFVSHGIFSKGVKTLLDSGISRVFTSEGEVFARNNSKNV